MNAKTNPILELCDITKHFNLGTINETTLFKHFTLSMEEGQFISVVGSNGSGKTTLLNIISGTLPCEGGKVLLKGRDITSLPEYKRASHIGRVFQNPSLGTVPDMTVLENLSLAENKGNKMLFSLAVNKKQTEEFRETVKALGLGLEDKMNIPVGLLSGGQRQALSLIMSTYSSPDLLLLDEHTAALDPKTAEIIMELTDKIVKEKHLTAIMVTHNLRYAVEYGDRMLMMHKGEAILDKSGDEKKNVTVQNLLSTFNAISVECGN